MAAQTNPEESDLDRVARLIAELDGEEFLLTGLDPSPSQAPRNLLKLVPVFG
jgi:hypothetical protein